jgi:hypothetical protein
MDISSDRAPMIDALGDLPIDVAEAMYSPDFVELTTLGPRGTPLALPMSFTLDIGGNVVRFSSPLNAARIKNLARDPRCCVSFSRVTSGFPPVVLQGVAALGDVAEGVRRGPVRRFTVTPRRILLLDDPPRVWRMAGGAPLGAANGSDKAARSGAAEPVVRDDVDAITRFETTVVALRDADGWPLALAAELRRDDDAIEATLPGAVDLQPVPGPASLLGHTWTKAGPRYLALTGRASIAGSTVRCVPTRAMRRP